MSRSMPIDRRGRHDRRACTSQAVHPHGDTLLPQRDQGLRRAASTALLGLSVLALPLGGQLACSDEAGGRGSSSAGAGGAGAGAAATTSAAATPTGHTVTSTTVTTTVGDMGVPTSIGAGDPCGECLGCAQCSQAEGGNCADELAACATDANADGCAGLLACLDACADATCVDACKASHAGGLAAFNALYDCVICHDCYAGCDGANDPACG